MTNASERVVDSKPRQSVALQCAWGYGAGLFIAIVAALFEMKHRGVGLRGVALVSYFVYWPIFGLAMGCLRWRGGAPVPENSSQQEQVTRSRRSGRIAESGFAVGLVYGLLATAIELLGNQWWILPGALVVNLLLFPLVGLSVGLKLGDASSDRKWWRRFMRFNMRTMMLSIAYLSLLFGLGVVASRIGLAAQRYFQQYLQADAMASGLIVQLPKSQAEALIRFRNAERLREGAIPADITQEQQDFLKSLDADEKVKPDYRRYRYNVMADGEEWLGRQAEVAVKSLTANIEYFSKLAAKYDRARKSPWLPVEPDPPRP